MEDYIDTAVRTAKFEKIDNGTRVYAELAQFPGAWAEGAYEQEVVKVLIATGFEGAGLNCNWNVDSRCHG